MSIFKKPVRIYFSSDKIFFESLYNILGFYPNNISLYKSAFRHSSASQKQEKESNERLEFLGDSVISAVISDYLFKKFPFKDEGFLTKIRSRMVSRDQHNKLALKLGLKHFIEVDDANLKRTTSNSIYGNAYEALIGAIYVDKGYNFTKEFLLKRIIHIHMDMDEMENKEVDFKSKIIEWAQKEKKQIVFKVIADGATSDSKQFDIYLYIEENLISSAQHFSKKRAEQLAAESACIIMEL